MVSGKIRRAARAIVKRQESAEIRRDRNPIEVSLLKTLVIYDSVFGNTEKIASGRKLVWLASSCRDCQGERSCSRAIAGFDKP